VFVKGSTGGYFYETDIHGDINTNYNTCLIIVSGEFGDATKVNNYEAKDESQIFKDIGLIKNPDFYIKLLINSENKNEGFDLQPKRMLYKKQLVKDWWGVSDRGIVLAITFSDINDKEKKGFASTAFTFSKVKPDLDLSEKSLINLTSQKMPKLPIPQSYLTLKEKLEDQNSQLNNAQEAVAPDKTKDIVAAISRVCDAENKLHKSDKKQQVEDICKNDEVSIKKTALNLEKSKFNLNKITETQALAYKNVASNAKIGAYNVDVILTETKSASKFGRSHGRCQKS